MTRLTILHSVHREGRDHTHRRIERIVNRMPDILVEGEIVGRLIKHGMQEIRTGIDHLAEVLERWNPAFQTLSDSFKTFAAEGVRVFLRCEIGPNLNAILMVVCFTGVCVFLVRVVVDEVASICNEETQGATSLTLGRMLRLGLIGAAAVGIVFICKSFNK